MPLRHLALLCTCLFASVLVAGESSPSVTVLVAPFENQSTAKSMVAYEVATGTNADQPKRTFTVDRYSEAPRAILEHALTGLPGVTVVERQRVDAMLLESDFGAFSGLVDGTSAAKLGNALGAGVIIQGTVMAVSVEVKDFAGYGVQTRRSIVTATVRVRSINIATGTVIASRLVAGQKAYTESQFGGAAESDVAYAVIDAALQQLTADRTALSTLIGTPTTGQSVSVRIEPMPPGCDVLVDGTYRGTAPITIELPRGAAVTVRLEKNGLTPWERKLVPDQVPVIAPQLVPTQPAP